MYKRVGKENRAKKAIESVKLAIILALKAITGM